MQVGQVVDLLAERARLLELAQPVGEALVEADLDAAETVDAAHHREVAAVAVDHAGGLDHAHHAGRAGHDGGEGGHRGVDAGFHQHFARDVAPGEVGHDGAPDREVRLAALELVDHVPRHRHRELDRVELGQRAVDLGEGRADARRQPDIRRAPHRRILRGLFERRGDVARRHAAQVAHLGRVERPRAMHGAAIVPDHQVALVPAVRVHELRLRRVLDQVQDAAGGRRPPACRGCARRGRRDRASCDASRDACARRCCGTGGRRGSSSSVYCTTPSCSRECQIECSATSASIQVALVFLSAARRRPPAGRRTRCRRLRRARRGRRASIGAPGTARNEASVCHRRLARPVEPAACCRPPGRCRRRRDWRCRRSRPRRCGA